MISIAWGLAIIANPDLHAAQEAELKPEKNKLEVAIAATGPLYLPIILANEAGYFSKRGVTVNLVINGHVGVDDITEQVTRQLVPALQRAASAHMRSYGL